MRHHINSRSKQNICSHMAATEGNFKMNKAKYRVSIYSIILYIVAALLAAFAIWTSVENYEYVKTSIDEALLYGQNIVKGNEFNIVSTIFSISGIYFGLAFGLVGIGIALQKITNVAVPVLRKLNGEQEEQTNYDYTPEFPYDPQAGYPVDEAFTEENVEDSVAEEAEEQIIADETQNVEQ